MPATIRTELPDGRKVAFAVETDYPRDGRIVVRIGDQSVGAWTLSVRVPHWADGAAAVRLNGAPYAVEPGGYVRLTRDFQAGDVVEITLPMEPRFTVADPRVDAVRGCVAVERGPEVLCLESVDTPQNVHVDLVRVDESVAAPRGRRHRPGARPHPEPARPGVGLALRRAAGGGRCARVTASRTRLRSGPTTPGATAARPRCGSGCPPRMRPEPVEGRVA